MRHPDTKPPGPSVRLIEDGEYTEAARIVLGSFRESTAATMEPRGVAEFEAFATADAMRARDANGAKTFVACLDGHVEGVLHITQGDHITLFFVSPARQRQGIGKALLATADAAGPLASVHASLNAVAAYQMLGFRATGPADLRNGIRYVPMRRLKHGPLDRDGPTSTQGEPSRDGR